MRIDWRMRPWENWSQMSRKRQRWHWRALVGMLERVQVMDMRGRNWK